MQWQTYIKGYPASVLITAALLGAMVGRRLASHMGPGTRPSASDWEAEAGRSVAARVAPGTVQPHSAATASWERLATRVEALVNRVIDEVADATEEALVPALVGGMRALLDGRSARSLYPPVPTTHTREGGVA
jgi:hypothetical protein